MRRCPFSHADWPLYQISFLSVASFSVESLAVANLATASLLGAVDFAGRSGFPPLGPSLLGFALAAPLSDFFWIAISLPNYSKSLGLQRPVTRTQLDDSQLSIERGRVLRAAGSNNLAGRGLAGVNLRLRRLALGWGGGLLADERFLFHSHLCFLQD
jgi:hypothetical protein